MSLVAFLMLLVAACGGETTAGGGGGDGDTGTAGKEGNDLLQVVKDRGTLIASTDPAYPPQSRRNPQGEFEGFDIDVTEEIAKRLGLDGVEYVTPPFDAIIAGSWGGRWDLSVGSVTITTERQKVLHFTPPYYFTPASIAVHQDNTDIQDVETDLDGKTIGVCVGCSYEIYLKKKSPVVGEAPEFVIDDAQIKTYDTDTTAIQDLAIGDGVRLDAVMSALPTLESSIDNETPIKIVGEPLFYEPLAVAIDKDSPEDPQAFVEEVSAIIEEMHADGTLTQLSEKWYEGIDLTQKV
jgi:polar amino acid transport system substrate-binding protein